MLACLIIVGPASLPNSSTTRGIFSVCQHGRVPTSPSPAITRPEIESTYAVIKPHIRLTPVVELSAADFGLAPFPLVLKLEHLQHAGSFKTRGAFANLLMREVPAAGVVAASGRDQRRAGAHGA